METSVRNHIRSNVVGYIALFVALSGTAAALPGTNTVDSGDIINKEVKTGDIGPGEVRTGDVADDNTPNALTGLDIAGGSLTGADLAADSVTGSDINEGTLGQVPSAALGGYGRSFSGNGCDPTSSTFIDCGYVTLNLPAQARVLITAVTRSYTPGGSNQFGFCRLVTSNGVLSGTDVGAIEREAIALTTVTGVLGPGSVDFGVECNQSGSDIAYQEVRISAVALSAN